MTLSNKKLLVLCHNYANFQKDQVEYLAPYFKEITVLVRFKPLAAWISSKLPSKSIQKYQEGYALQLRNLPKNVRVIPVPTWYLPGRRFYYRAGDSHLRNALNLIRKQDIQFDLIHAHFAWSSGYVGAELKRIYGVPFFLTVHGYDIYDLPQTDAKWHKAICRVLSKADRIIAVSSGMAELCRKLTPATAPKTIPNGYNCQHFLLRNRAQCRKDLHLDLEKKIILAVGNLEKVKNHMLLLKALRSLPQKLDIQCIIIGSGSQYGPLESYVKTHCLSGIVQFIGAIPHHEVSTWMNSADVFCLPSQSESFGIVQLEAWACGIPVVATRTGGSLALITDPKLGILTDLEDPRALAEGLTEALTKQWDRTYLQNHARQFSWERIAKRISDEFRDVIEN